MLDNAVTPPPFVCPLTLEIVRDPVLLPDGFTYERGAIENWLSRQQTVSPMTNKPFRALPVQIIQIKRFERRSASGSVIENWAARYKKSEEPAKMKLRDNSNSSPIHPFKPEERLHIINRSIPLTFERVLSEKLIHPDVCALQALHKSAKLAQLGKYHESRVNLISAQRLLQRNLKSKSDCFAYMSFIGEAESLDQFMREKAMQEVVLNGAKGNALTADSSSRDDDASKNMYQSKSLTLAKFKSNMHRF